jgi:hypothetical protein
LFQLSRTNNVGIQRVTKHPRASQHYLYSPTVTTGVMCYPPAAGWSLHPEVGKDGDAEEKSKRLLKSHGLHGAPPEILSTCLQRAIVRPNARDAPPPTCTRARRLVSWRRLRRPAPVWQASSWGHGRDGAIRHSEDRHVLNTRFGESHPPGHLCSVVLHRSCWLAKTVS